MTRRIVGAFPLGSSRAEVEARLQHLHLDEFIVAEEPAMNLTSIHVTTAGIVCPARPAGEEDVVLHIPNWAKSNAGAIARWAARHAIYPYHIWFRFEGKVLRAVELRQHHQGELFRASAVAAVEHWREAARKGVVVFTYGVPEDD